MWNSPGLEVKVISIGITDDQNLQLVRRGRLPVAPRRIAFSGDGTLMAAHVGREIAMWSMDTGGALPSLSVSSAPEVMVFSDDNQFLACLPGRVWDLSTGAPCDEFDHDESMGVFLSHHDTLVTCHAKTGVLCLYDASSGQVVRKRDEDNIPITHQMPKGVYTSMALSPDGHWIVMANKAGLLYRLAVESLGTDFDQTLPVGQEVTVLAFSADGLYLAVGGAEGRIHLFEVQSWKERARIAGTYGSIRALAVVPASPGHPPTLLSAAADRSLRLWNVRSGSDTWRTFVDDLQEVTASFDGRVVAGTAGDSLWLWDLAEAEADLSAPEPLKLSFGLSQTGSSRLYPIKGDKISAMALVDAAPSCLVAVGTLAGEVDMWRLNGAVAVPQQVPMDSIMTRIQALAVAREGEAIAAGTESGAVFVWEPATSRVPRRLSGHADAITAIVFADSIPVLVSGSQDGTVRVWNRQDNRQIYVFDAHQQGVRALAFDGNQRLISAGWDASVALWDLATGRELHRLHLPRIHRLPEPHPGYAPPIHSLRLKSAAGPLVATWQNDGLEAIELVTGRSAWRVEGISPTAQGFFSDDGRRLALMKGGLLQLWDVACGLRQDTLGNPPPGGTDPILASGMMSPGGTYVLLQAADSKVYYCLISDARG